jgi:hypothetical protein
VNRLPLLMGRFRVRVPVESQGWVAQLAEQLNTGLHNMFAIAQLHRDLHDEPDRNRLSEQSVAGSIPAAYLVRVAQW